MHFNWSTVSRGVPYLQSKNRVASQSVTEHVEPSNWAQGPSLLEITDMTDYRCVAIRTEDAERFRRAAKDDFGHRIQRLTSDRSYPCRHCLREASAKNGMLLLSYQTPKPQSVYGQPTAVFLCAHACEQFEQPNTIADIVNNRLVSFRAFQGDGMMIYDANRIGEGGNYDPIVRTIFARDDVAYINAHTAKAGCLLCHIERA